VILWSRRERKPANQYEIVSIWWLFPFVGALTFLFSAKPVPYYRFINASAAPVALVGLGAFIAIRWFLRREGTARIAGVLASILVVGALGWVFVDGLRHDWTSDRNQWVNEGARTSLAAVHTVAEAAGARPIVLVVNHDNVDDSTGTNTAYGWAKTFTNIFRTGLPGTSAEYQATYLGRLEDFLAGQPSTGPSTGYRKISHDYWNEFLARRKAFPADPLVFVIGQYYGGAGDKSLVQTDGVSIGPDVTVITKAGSVPLWTPPQDVVAAAQQAAKVQAAAFADAPGPLSDPLHLLRVLLGLLVLAILPGLLAAPFFELDDTPSRIALIPGMSIVMTLLAGIAVLTVWRGPLTSTKAWAVVGVAVGTGALLRLGRERVLGVLRSFGGFFNGLFAVFSKRDYAVLMGVQFLAQAGQGVVQGAIAKSIAFGGQKGFDVQTVPSASYLLKVVLALYVPYMLISPFIGVFIDRFERRRVAWWAMVLSAILVAAIAVAVLLPLGKGTTSGRVGATAGLILGLLVVQAVARVILAVKSAAIPDVLQGIDLMQGNGLSQAGGGLLQVVGIAFGGVAAGILPPWIVVVVGSVVLAVGAIVSRQLQHAELHPHATSFAREASQVVRNIVAGLKEVAGRAPAALGLSSFQMLRYQFWGFVLFTWALYAKNLVKGGSADTLSLILSGVGGLAGGALGVVVAQKLKDRVPPVRILIVSMVALGVSVVVFGSLVSVAGFAVLLFMGFFTFFTGKISTDTITQQTMPDDFRGRAFALFDIAYNLGYIIPAFILSLVWIENDSTRTRTILVVSGLVFLGLTALVAAWSRRIRDQFAPQDDLVVVE
jgi:MFS family permease